MPTVTALHLSQLGAVSYRRLAKA